MPIIIIGPIFSVVSLAVAALERAKKRNGGGEDWQTEIDKLVKVMSDMQVELAKSIPSNPAQVAIDSWYQKCGTVQDFAQDQLEFYPSDPDLEYCHDAIKDEILPALLVS
jgi:hypothetical protein